ncbi:uncharacterized protein LOC110855593 [Folsomia candida]|uniref:uncharacterized protein LOC110855593 n=1 Tax=Folsomia candida TaxID=158441 RepID=UPI001604CD3F|nr:uncharacterized protein LOC110855593 [Folsomia candida]
MISMWNKVTIALITCILLLESSQSLLLRDKLGPKSRTTVRLDGWKLIPTRNGKQLWSDQYHWPILISNSPCEQDCRCPAWRIRPVCGSDGVTYRNHCYLHCARVCTGIRIQIVHEFQCYRPQRPWIPDSSPPAKSPTNIGWGWIPR